jgi:DNA-binding PadR family transcriptional regulator
MLNNINSGAEYAQLLINSIKTAESELSLNEQMDPMLLECWIELIEEKADKSYNDYIIGKRETFLMDENEISEMFKTAHENYVQKMLNSMVDKDLLEVSIGEEGDLLYGLSDKGRDEASRMFGDKEK